jgi:multisubunit Na+/H+ antiporter MnhF subunit
MTGTLDIAAALLLLAGVVLALLRAVRGPSMIDRVVAVDALALMAIGWLLLETRRGEGRVYLDAALGLALFSFVGVVLLARLLGRGEIDD